MTAILISPLYILANLYLFRRISAWIGAWMPVLKAGRLRFVPAAVYMFFALSFIAAFLLPAGELRRGLKLIGNYWMGVLMYMLLAVAAADVIRLVLFHVFSLREALATPTVHRAVGLICAAALAAVTLGGVANAHNVRVTPYDITVGKSAGEMRELKIVLAADLHLGYNVGLAQVQRMVEKINEQNANELHPIC